MPARKRGRDEMEAAGSATAAPDGLLTRLRNTWYFANVFQFVQLFAPALGVSADFDIEDYEEECLKPGSSERLAEIALAICKYAGLGGDRGPLEQRALTIYRRLNREAWDEKNGSVKYAAQEEEGNNQNVEKKQDNLDEDGSKKKDAGFDDFDKANNPFGTKDAPVPFASFDIFTKLRMMQQWSQWIFKTTDSTAKFVDRMTKNADEKEVSWRIEEFGWDSEDRAYFLLDDNRLYRRTAAPPALPTPSPTPPPKPRRGTTKKAALKKKKASSKPAPRQGARRSLRGRPAASEEPEPDPESEQEEEAADAVDVQDSKDTENETSPAGAEGQSDDNGLGGGKWECLCITLQDYEEFLESIKKSRDQNEKALYKRLMQHVLPVIQEVEDARARKVAKRERDLQVLEKLATAKRSSRLAGKAAKEQEEQQAREEQEKRESELRAARKLAERQEREEQDRISRTQTRDQRNKERHLRQILHEQELKELEEEKERMERGEVSSKRSERQLNEALKKTQEMLAQTAREPERWLFDCVKCGEHAWNPHPEPENIIECERCKVWQHIECLGIIQEQLDDESFQFICQSCKQREADALKPKIKPLKFPANVASPSQPQKDEDIHVNGNSQDGAQAPGQLSKRKASDVDGSNQKLPPMKKFKPYAPPQQSTTSTQVNGTTMHSTLLNGPTLSPQGQVESPVNGTRPPGLVSPQRPTHSTSPMQFGPPLHSTAAQPPTANGHSPQKASTIPRTPAQNDPFRNTFASQAPGSAQSRVSPYQAPVPTAQGATRMAPPQTTPNTSFQGNGSFQHAGPSTPAQYASVPQKQSFAAPSPAPSANLQASSPPMAPPLRPDAASAGLSPVKNSPPRPASRDVNLTPVVPPTAKLMPSPKQKDRPNTTGAESPVKPSPLQSAPEK